MATTTDCHHCGQAMRQVDGEPAQQAGGERSSSRSAAHRRYLCSQCGATRVSASLALDGTPFSFDPFDNYAAIAAYPGGADEPRLRMPVVEKE